jgi:hypothetical protein
MNIRLTALDVVKAAKDNEYLPFLKYIMDKDPEIKVRKKAVQVYAKVEKESEVLDLFEKKLNSGDYYTRHFVIEAMKEMELEQTIALLRKNFFEKDNHELRLAILKLLAQKKDDPQAFSLLQDIAMASDLKGYRESVQTQRIYAMRVIAQTGWNQAFPVLQKIGEDFLDPLYVSALQLITGLNPEKAGDYFLEQLQYMQGKPYSFRFQVAKSVSQLKPEGAEEKLKEAFFNSYDMTIRSFIGRILRTYGHNPDALERQYQQVTRPGNQR